MRHIALTLAVLGALALANDQASADPGGSHATMLVKHGRAYGHPGYHAYRGYRSPGPGCYHHARPYGHGPVIVHPPVWGHPPVIVHPPVRRYHGYHYRPHSGFSYHGRGFGFSIRF
jgi:hypothetical protein